MASFADYDEFGNYIGPDIDSDDDEEMEPVQQQAQQQPLEGFDDEQEDEDEPADDRALMQIGNTVSLLSHLSCTEIPYLSDSIPRNQVILHEDKKYYPTAQEVYGEDVETMVQEEDAQPLSEPIVAPVKVRKWAVEEKGLPETRFDKGYAYFYTYRIDF